MAGRTSQAPRSLSRPYTRCCPERLCLGSLTHQPHASGPHQCRSPLSLSRRRQQLAGRWAGWWATSHLGARRGMARDHLVCSVVYAERLHPLQPCHRMNHIVLCSVMAWYLYTTSESSSVGRWMLLGEETGCLKRTSLQPRKLQYSVDDYESPADGTIYLHV